MKPIDELFSIVFSDFCIDTSTWSVFSMAATLEVIELFDDLRTIGEYFPWLSDRFAVDDGFKAKHTTVKRNRLQLKILNELNDLCKFPVFAVPRPFNGNKVVVFLRANGDSLKVFP